MSEIASDRSRAAASSMASGMPVELPADRGDGGTVGLVKQESQLVGGRAVEEQADGFAVREGVAAARRLACGGDGQGRHAVDVLTGHAERLAARHEQVNLAAAPQNGVRELRRGVENVLAIVQDDEQVPGPQRVHQGVESRPARRPATPTAAATTGVTRPGSFSAASSASQTACRNRPAAPTRPGRPAAYSRPRRARGSSSARRASRRHIRGILPRNPNDTGP
jgi:hypothetical protein